MEPFLLKVAHQILAENPGRTEQVLVVFNNHRPELFLHEQFKKISAAEGTAFFMPQTMVIDDLVADMSGLEVVPPEFLLFELYRIHMEMEGENRKYQTFEEFIPFGELMIGDFSEIDRYMVDARDLFQNLHRMKEVMEWDVENPVMSDFQRNYLHFYQSLYEYYRCLHERLEARGQAYAGMAYRRVASNIGQLAKDCQWSTTYFVGFNAISECERTIIGEFVRKGRGHLLTDGDSYYFDDEHQEAGYFLRRNSKEFSELGHFGPSLFATTEKKITIVECPENVLQCKFAGQLLTEHPDWIASGTEGTAIVLADESLLIPTLNGLPDIPGNDYRVNVTMGFPFADSQLHTLVLNLITLYRRHNGQGYYHADVTEVLSDWYVSHLTGMTSPRQSLNKLMEREKLVRTEADRLQSLSPNFDLAELMPPHQLTPDECLEQVRHVVALLTAEGSLTANEREKQAVGDFEEVIEYLQRLQAEYNFIQSIDTLGKIYLRIAQRHTISFLGKPLSGLQILGMLETRNLDFRRVILLSAGEGVLPAARSTSTLIPLELQRAFHLPTYEEKDSVYAYNFYRLLQRAKEIYLVYSSDFSNAGKGEESRLLRQVRSELARRFPQTVEVADWVVDTGGGLHQKTDIPMPGAKSEAVMQRLFNISEGFGFAPTSLKNYMECPLKYYYMNVLRLRDRDEVEDDIDASELGEAVHNVMETIYKPLVGQRVDPRVLREARNDIDSLLDVEMDRLLRGGRSHEGKNLFLRSVAHTQLCHALEREIAIAEKHTLEFVAAEEQYSYTLWEQEGHPVRIAGRVDRIDRLDGILRVIDYKTGSLSDDDLAFGGRKTVMSDKWLQLMCYALMYRRRFPSDESLRVGIYPLRYLRSDIRLASWDKQEEMTNALIDQFEETLRNILADILNREQPFVASASTNSCKYCPAAAFCPANN